MQDIITPQQIRKVDVDVHVRMRHHAPAVQAVGEILLCCIFGNANLRVEGFHRDDRYGYCYRITTPSEQKLYITYDHDREIIFVKDKLRNYTVVHEFDNDAPMMQIVEEVRRIFV